jgi:diguanylate cyclase (GGDEF)-like protein/PAS domain S-box-containing protein
LKIEIPLVAGLRSEIEISETLIPRRNQKMDPLEKEIDLLRSLHEVVQDPLLILSLKGEFLKVNPKGTEILGYPWEELQHIAFLDLVAVEDLEKTRDGFEEMKRGKEARFRTHLLTRLREKIPFELIGNERGEYVFITLKDLRGKVRIEEEVEKIKNDFTRKIQERDQYARELQAIKDLYKEKVKEIETMREEAIRLSYIDDLTSIFNHRYFIEQLTNEVERVKRYPSPLSLMMIDIDYFKHYNDTNGHLAGDDALKAIAILIRRGVRHNDIVARYGGEEFSAILINTGKKGAFETAERVRKNVIDTPFPNEQAQPNGDLTVSIGVATFSPPIVTLTDLIREADSALYRAKRAGRNRIEG